MSESPEPTPGPVVEPTLPDSVLAAIQAYGDARAAQQAASDAAELSLAQALQKSAEQTCDSVLASLRRRESSQAFGHRIGVNIHSTFQRSVYKSSNYDAVLRCLQEVGVSWVRDNLGGPTQWARQYAFWQRLAEEGIAVHAVVGTLTDVGLQGFYSRALNQAKDLLVRVEGWNEPDKWQNWMDLTVAHQLWLGTLAHTDLGVPVVGPALHTRNVSYSTDVATLYERISGSYDLVNLHCYPGGGQPASWYLDQQLAVVQQFGKPIITEGGYNTGLGINGHGTAVGESLHADLTADYVRQARIRGIDIAVYELLDDPDTDNDNWEAHFGLYRCPSLTPDTWSPKPVVDALARLPR